MCYLLHPKSDKIAESAHFGFAVSFVQNSYQVMDCAKHMQLC